MQAPGGRAGRVFGILALGALTSCTVAAARKVGGFGDLQPGPIVRSGQRPLVRGSVVRRCPLHDAPVADFPLALFLPGREEPVGRTVSGPDGSFVLRADYVDQTWTSPILQVGDWRLALPGDADGDYDARLLLDCDTGKPYLPARGDVQASPANLAPP